MARSFSYLASLFVAGLLARPSEAAVWTVSPPGGGGQFTTIQAAIDAASSGDTVLVMPGPYAPFILNKPLRVLGAGPSVTVLATVPLFSSADAVVVTGIPAGDFAMVAGMTIVIADSGPSPCSFFGTPITRRAVSVTNCAGPVVLSNLTIGTGFSGWGIKAGASSLLMVDHVVVAAPPFPCGAFSLTCSTDPCPVEAVSTAGTNVSVNDSNFSGIPTASALQVNGGAQALLARTGLQGADGITIQVTFGTPIFGLPGGHGLEANGASIRIAAGPGAFAMGGDGGWGSCPLAFPPGGNGNAPGGDAIHAGPANVLRAPDLSLLPGAGAGSGPCAAAPGAAVSGSTVIVAPAPLPSLGVSPALASPGGSIALDVRGAPGSLYFVGAADAPAFLPIAGVGGPLLLDPATLVVAFSGTLDPTGSDSIAAPVPPDPSLSTTVLFLQPATSDAGGLSLGPAVPLVVL